MKRRTMKKRASRAKYGYRLFAIWNAGRHDRWLDAARLGGWVAFAEAEGVDFLRLQETHP